MPQVRAAERGSAECAEHAERLTYRRRPVPPLVGYRAAALPWKRSGYTLHGKKSRPPRGAGVPPVGIMAKMPMPRHATTETAYPMTTNLSRWLREAPAKAPHVRRKHDREKIQGSLPDMPRFGSHTQP